ncbi:hypothetical protein D3C87_85110 [compost metagenome]
MKYAIEITSYETSEGFWRPGIPEEIFSNWIPLLEIENTGFIVYHNLRVHFLDLTGKWIWEEPIICAGVPNRVVISGNRLIVTTRLEKYDRVLGYMGRVHLINLEKGILIKKLQGERMEALTDGRFVLGLGGYNLFDTWMYDGDGNLLQNWRSCGNYLVDGEEILVIENDFMQPTKSQLVKLLPNGEVIRGEHLKTYWSSEPLRLVDKDFVYENFGELKIANTNLEQVQSERFLAYEDRDSWKYLSNLRKEGKDFVLRIIERTGDDPLTYTTHHWTLKINKNGSDHR